MAASRLAVLSRQLSALAVEDLDSSTTSGGIQAQQTKAAESEVRPAPGGGKGTLTVFDNRTGKKYTVRSVTGFNSSIDPAVSGMQDLCALLH